MALLLTRYSCVYVWLLLPKLKEKKGNWDWKSRVPPTFNEKSHNLIENPGIWHCMPLILKIFEIKISIFLHGFNTVLSERVQTLVIYSRNLSDDIELFLDFCLDKGWVCCAQECMDFVMPHWRFFSWGVFYFGPHPPLKKSNSLAAVWRKLSHY